ncbi:hypothetical protein BX070DRAFT_218505 [Coemansia spiralis]|nr:hypothetical protein BX070DRAFT_218505 [Coemansia spiralis]
MTILSLFLLLSSAYAQSQSASTSGAVSSAAESNIQDSSENASSLSAASPEVQKEVAYVPLFDFDLAPYNVALDIVAEALEKLADTMEPLDLPLPLVGPGYYLEVMVKSPKNPLGPPPQRPPPFGQVTPISIEGGEAPLVTEIEVILPGESVAHQTIKLPVGGTAEVTLVQTADEQATAGNVSVPTIVPEPEPATNAIPEGEDTSKDNISTSTTSDSNSSTPTENNEGPVSDGYLAGQTEAFPVGNTGGVHNTVTPTISGSQLAQSMLPDPMEPMDTVSGFGTPEKQPSVTSTLVGIDTNVNDSSTRISSIKSSELLAPSFVSNELGTVLAQTSSSFELETNESMNSEGLSGNTSSSDEVDGLAGQLGGQNSQPYASDNQENSASTGVVLATSSESLESTEAAVSIGSIDIGSIDIGIPSSAPILADSSAVISQFEQSSLFLSQGTISEAASSIEEDTINETLNTSDMTMESMPLPFPPFGDPQQQQQQQQPTASSLEQTAATAVGSFSPSTEKTAATNTELVETIDIVNAPNANVLESSIDAILHSIIEEYQTESTPKAAVGFALIHPRRQQAGADRRH